jgi:predicted nucleotide-binding protein
MAKRKPQPPPTRPPSLGPEQALKLLRAQFEKGNTVLANRPITSAKETTWKTTALSALESAFGSDSPNVRAFQSVKDFAFGGGNETEWERDRARRMDERLSLLEGLIELLETETKLAKPSGDAPSQAQLGHRVFLVHGHDEAVLHGVARFVQGLGIEVVILREQPNKGRTIIEKFIEHATNVGFAIVLLTGDDRGGAKTAAFEVQLLRARQNVILELGFFLGKLGRMRVCALYQKDVEIPSDYSGVLFVPFDDAGGWKLALAKEMKSAGLPIDINKAI